MKLSASQLETAELCLRKWKFKSDLRLPEVKKDSTQFGNVLHAAAERYLLGANPADLWPPGWNICPDTKQPITPADSALVQVLVTEALKSGVLERRPSATVEEMFEVEIGDGDSLVGKIDYGTEDRVEDHKTSKSKRYFKSAESLKTNLQLLIYAKHKLERLRKLGKVPPKFISLAHNQYLRDLNNPLVQRREAEVTPSEIDEHWNTKVMELVQKVRHAKSVANPFELPDPDKGACNAFGGCPYTTICSGSEDVLTYRRRLDRHLNKETSPTTTMTSPQSFLASRMGTAPAPAVNPPLPTTQAPAAATPTPAAATVTTVLPPWANPTCPVCSKRQNRGFNAEGRPCRICLNTTKVSADGYTFTTRADGLIEWRKAGEVAGTMQATGPATSGATKVAYGIDELTAKLRMATSLEGAIAVMEEGQKVLAPDSPELRLFSAAVEKHIEALEVSANTSLPPTPPIARISPVLAMIEAAKTNSELLDIQIKHMMGAPFSPAEKNILEAAHVARSKALAAVSKAVATITDPSPTTVEPIPPTTEAPKRRGRPKGSKNTAPAAQGDAPPSAAGIGLLIGACVLRCDDREVVMAEDILHGLPGYWQQDDVWKRRGDLRRTIEAGGEILKGLEGLLIVQSVREPDVDNLMSALLPVASFAIRGIL